MSTTITVDEWLAEMERLTAAKRSDDGLTAEELAEAAGCTVKKMRERLRKVAAAGRLVVGTKLITRIDGRPNPVPAYRLRPSSTSCSKSPRGRR